MASPPLLLSKGWIFLATLVVQLVLLSFAFPLPTWEQGQGLFHIDHPFHLYQVTLGRALLEHGNLVGYDPFFGGGNLGGATFNVSAKLPVLISLLIPNSVSTESLYLYYVFVCALIAPISIVAVGVLLRWPAVQTAVAAMLGIFFWWIGAFHWYHTAGMVSFVCACYTSIPYSVWVYRLISNQIGRFPFLQLGIAGTLGGLGLWLHPFFGVIAGAVITGFLLAHYREFILPATLAKGIAVGLIALILNTPWILAMRTGSNMLELEYVHQIDVGVKFLANAIFGIWDRSMGSLLNPLVVIFGIIALFIVNQERRRDFIPFLATGVALIIFASFGAKLKVFAGLQPNRFLAPGFLIIGIAASYAIADSLSRFQTKRKRVPKLFVLSVAVLITAILIRELVREISPGSHGRYGKAPPEVSYTPKSVAWLVSWITENTTPEGRILFETSLARKHGGGHIAGYLALRTKREFIGAPYPFLMPERSFWDRAGFGHPIAELTSKQLTEGLNLYNAGWVIAHTKELVHRMEKLPEARLLAQQGDIYIFGINRPLSYFQEGNAQIVERNFNQLGITTKSGNTLIMRYQWVNGITTTPASKIEPILLSPDFPPFIRISSAPEHFLIQFK